MKSFAYLLLVAFAAAPASAQPPRDMSRNPRVGLLAELQFRAGSTTLPDATGSQLGRIAAWADENYDGLLVIDTHSDRAVRSREATRVALRRARLVREQLLALGVDSNQIVISVFAPTNRRFGKVAIWGTRNSLDSVMAMRRGSHALVVAPYRDRPLQSPTLMGRR
jgi:hypothetical protein